MPSIYEKTRGDDDEESKSIQEQKFSIDEFFKISIKNKSSTNQP